VASVVGVDWVPPERLLYRDRIERTVEQPDAAAGTESETCGEQGLDHRDPASADDQGGQQLEAVD